MKRYITLFVAFFILCINIYSQENNTLKGRLLYLNSSKKPAVGVKVSGIIDSVLHNLPNEKASSVYTSSNGEFVLKFPNARVGYKVNLVIGEEDAKGQVLEVVNINELTQFRVPAIATDFFEIIVCKKGERDIAAQKYYNILKSSSEKELSNLKEELNRLLDTPEKDYEKISSQSDLIAKLELRMDSLTIYKQAYQIASINKDNSSDRVLKYLKLLDEGKSIQEAIKELSIKNATEGLRKSSTDFQAAIKELETNANASVTIFDYSTAVACYDTMIFFSEKMGIDPLKISLYYMDASNITYNDGKYELTLEYQQKGISLQEKVLSPKDHILAASYVNIGTTYNILGDYQKALEFQQKAITIRESNLDTPLPELADSYGSISTPYHALGDYQKALEFQQKSISIIEEVFGPEYRSLTTSYNNIAMIYHSLGDYQKALEFQQKDIAISEKIYPKKHPLLASAYGNIGNIYYSLEDYQKALEFQEKAFSITTEILNPKHPYLATSSHNLAMAYYGLEKYQDALKLQQKVIEIREEILPPNHPSLATTYSNMAMYYVALKNYSKALEFHKKDISLREKTLDPAHPELGLSYWNVAFTYMETKNYEKAKKYQELAESIFKSTLPEDHPFLARVFNTRLEIYHSIALDAFERKEYYIAVNNIDTVLMLADSSYSSYNEIWELRASCYLELISLQEKSPIPADSLLINSYYNYAITCKALRKYSWTLQYFEKAISQLEDLNQNHNNDDLLKAYYGKGTTYNLLKMYQRALEYYDKSIHLILQEYKGQHSMLVNIYQSKAVTYNNDDQFQKAIINLQKAVDLGFNDLKWLKTDDSLENIRNEEAFQKLIKQLEEKQIKN